MDNKKDMQAVRNMEEKRVFDITTAGPFGANQACAYAYKKTERILLALHLVTNFVPYDEPARATLRDKSITLLSDILTLRSGLRSAGSERVNVAIMRVCEISSLLDVLHAAGFVSDMNLQVIRRELDALALFLREVEDREGAEGLNLSDTYFETREDSQGQNIKDTKMSFNLKDKKTSTQDQRQSKGQKEKGRDTGGKKQQRRETILSIIKDKGQVSVKDISAQVTSCSEKTLQRELGALVEAGVLKKEGERRWSAYSLA